MADDDRFDDKVDEGSGKVKETAGKATGDEDLRREGETQKDTAQLKEQVKDTVDKAKEAFRKK